MEASDYLIIDQYLQGELPEEAQPAFEQRLQNDPAFAEALQERQQMHSYLKHQVQKPALEKRMADLGAQYFQDEEDTTATSSEGGKVVPLWRRKSFGLVAAAAAIALILLVWNPFQTSANLYEQYAMHPTLALQERNVDGISLETAEQAFNQGEYEAAFTQLSALVQQLPENPQLRLSLGIAALETGRTVEARTQFEALANGKSALQDYGRWYMALSYIKTGDYEAARPLLQALAEQPSAFQQQAQDLLSQL
jgi:tetratricopeptide (TPR) repeat protein